MKPSRKRIPGPWAQAAQAASLVFFWLLLLGTVWPEAWLPVDTDFFLQMDPLAAVLAPLAGREWTAALLPGIAILALSLAAGRFFCGWLCPFGATLTFARRLLWGKAPAAGGENGGSGTGGAGRTRNIKFLALALMFGAALAGVNDFYWGTPIPLITRFYALLIHPVLLLLAQLGLTSGQPLFAALDLPSLRYLDLSARRFDGLYFLLVFFGLLLWLERRQPRFWCRCLCPAGALLALVSQRPLFRRRVGRCSRCSRCARFCPMGAIDPQTMQTRHRECIACRACVAACPTRAVTFAPWKGHAEIPPERTADIAGQADLPDDLPNVSPRIAHFPLLPSRRAFLGSAGLGLLLAGVQRSDAYSLLNADNRSLPPHCIRPPGAVPEPLFLALCLRCGECMKVCPSNALQPAWLTAGFEGLFSPLLAPRRGPCVPDCNACGQVCPTQAIRPLPLEEKRWARVGTAVVLQNTCLAWAWGRACIVCQEVCPYGAVKLQKMEGFAAPAPVVNNERCYGCGYCERHCPLSVPAIVVEPLNALRLTEASYRRTALAAGMDYTLPEDGAEHPETGSEAGAHGKREAGPQGIGIRKPGDGATAAEGSGHEPDAPEGSLPPGFSP
ncbi:MAG: 4Fe-4S binding protein [Desulfovibrio sp.]|jgi:MauM/NapG family ferredoxin protein|nr:4Fe-4S binding protein [Desulfovibrio sp.]